MGEQSYLEADSFCDDLDVLEELKLTCSMCRRIPIPPVGEAVCVHLLCRRCHLLSMLRRNCIAESMTSPTCPSCNSPEVIKITWTGEFKNVCNQCYRRIHTTEFCGFCRSEVRAREISTEKAILLSKFVVKCQACGVSGRLGNILSWKDNADFFSVHAKDCPAQNV
jgi:hypothetical protein